MPELAAAFSFIGNPSMIQLIRSLIQRTSVEGVLDGLSGNTLQGWAHVPGPSAPPLRIEASVGERVIGADTAQAFRQDLAEAGKRAGRCGFAIFLDPLPSPGTVITVTAVLPDGRRWALSGSPLTLPVPEPVAPPVGTPTDVLPLPIATSQVRGSLDQCGPGRLRGWAHWIDGTSGAVPLSLYEGEYELLQVRANQWRADLAELREGDGCCGFDVELPAVLCDGEAHTLDLRRSDTGTSVLQRPFRTRAYHAQSTGGRKSSAPAALERTPQVPAITLSVIVNFYNMRREAERTLTSLCRNYQSGSEDLDYEVLCIDNGSNPPLDAAWIESLGPEFRLIKPTRQLASPCAAINEAALQAKGRYLAIMIDGAHLLTPGVFQEARKSWCEHADAVVAIRHWFIGGDQRWLAVAGYSRQMEDRLFDRIQWPSNGYELFRISAPIGESPEPWLGDLSESNCLMLPTELYDRIGGMDEAFGEAGGGFANLDLWQRASDAAKGPLISLIGEASFHQFHGGTTTNVEDAEKDVRVRAYANNYRALRGQECTSVHRTRLQFRGSVQTEFATGIRQRSLVPARLEITEGVRAGQLSIHFDEGAQAYLQSVYAECRLQEDVNWMGAPTGVAPADLISLQEIIRQLRPDAIITVSIEAGLAIFLDHTLSMTVNEGARILCIDSLTPATTLPHRITILQGDPDSPQTLATAGHWTGSAETVLVLYAANRQGTFSAASLHAYAALVSYRSYLICLGTLFGQPWLGYSNRQTLKTIREFTESSPAFVIDRSWNRQLITTCPSGYLRKTGQGVNRTNYDPSFDEIAIDQLHPENV